MFRDPAGFAVYDELSHTRKPPANHQVITHTHNSSIIK